MRSVKDPCSAVPFSERLQFNVMPRMEIGPYYHLLCASVMDIATVSHQVSILCEESKYKVR